MDPLPTYIPPHEDPQTRPDLARRFPLQMLSPPVPAFLNSTFANVASLRKMAGEPTVEMHLQDAASRGITAGQWVRVFNDRGSFQARAVVGDGVKPGVVVSQRNLLEQIHSGQGQLQHHHQHASSPISALGRRF